ncbi:hypothetical protein JK359_16095 [Streptomyces actinomycinicus]|uniref:Uncharacterized protein n=1 Tax=Streptomyces actinomycinicus TaxID=1695166 RepID=A0A937EJL8_9ACTN|nr:hypothetical protein [Streptomyces actinomycinicus]MBL1083475.1 hypothetical protein [Streptomyces actinomycinicus]
MDGKFTSYPQREVLMAEIHGRPGKRGRRMVIGVLSAALVTAMVPVMTHAADAGRADPAHEKGDRGRGWVEESFFAEVPRDGVFETHRGDLPLAVFPGGIAKFTESRLQKAFALGSKIRDKNGEVVGFATEIEEVLPETDFETGKMLTHTVWTLFFPGRGTIVLNQFEDSSEVATKVFKPAFDSGEPWTGRLNAVTTAGPRADGKGEIIGGTGEFAGIRGSGIEIADIRRFDPANGSLEGTFELRFRYHRTGR